MIDKTTSRVIMGLLGTACVLITAFAWYKTKYAAVPEAGICLLYTSHTLYGRVDYLIICEDASVEVQGLSCSSRVRLSVLLEHAFVSGAMIVNMVCLLYTSVIPKVPFIR